VGFCARGSLILLGPPAARADSPAAGALWLWTRRLSKLEVIVEEATDLSLVGDWRVDPTLRMLSSRECCCCQGGNIDEKVVVVVDSCATGDVVTVGWKSSAGFKGAGVNVVILFFLDRVGDSKLTGRNSFRSLEGLAPALFGVHTTGGASSTVFVSWMFLLLESRFRSVDGFKAGDQIPFESDVEPVDISFTPPFCPPLKSPLSEM